MYLFKQFQKIQYLLGFFYMAWHLTGCDSLEKAISFTGLTMGTTYSITIILEDASVLEQDQLKIEIDSVLTEVNRQMSPYLPESEISRFNRNKLSNSFTVSDDFASVVERSLIISELTEGAFDITVQPLLNIWGFGPAADQQNNQTWKPPDHETIKQMLKSVGYTKLVVQGIALKKIDPDVSIDLNAIAKGFGVDKVAEWIEYRGLKRYLVEIGGEIRCRGYNENDVPWRIGIDMPRIGTLPGQEIGAIVSLLDQAMATSGDYRNFIQFGNRTYSHTIDPKTGYPVETDVASATVIAPTCMDADAIATGLMVLGEKKGLATIESLENVEVLLIIREGKDQFRMVKSSGMRLLEE